MGAIPYAFSVHHFISTVGADAGFAAIIGLAILILLYFSQARETASLRDWAAESAEHVRQLESRLAQLTRAQASSPSTTNAPAPPPPGVVRAGASPAVPARAGLGVPVSSRTAAPLAAAAVPAAPAGVGAPALSAATRLIPSSDREPISIRAGSGSAVASDERRFLDGDTMMAAAGPPPATAAGAANGSAPPRAPAPVSVGALPTQSPAASRPAAPRPAAARPAVARPTGSGPRRPASPPSRTGSSSGGRSPMRRGVIAVLALLGLIAVVVVVLVIASGGSPGHTNTAAGSGSATAGAKTSQGRTTRAAATPAPSTVTVAVLNGTATPNLAHTIAGRLAAVGFKQGNVVTAADQTQTATVVGYLPHHRPDALIVARSLKLGPASVQPVDQSNQTVACPPSSTPCSAQVVVTVGSDLAPNT